MLSLLRVDTFTVPSGTALLEKVVAEVGGRHHLFDMPCNRLSPQTFFDLHFEPDIMVGPAALDFLTDFFCRNSASVEGVLSTLQLAHLKHFDEPLSIFMRDERLDASSAKHAIKKLSDPKAATFLISLFSCAFGPQELASDENGWPVNDVAGLLASVADARADFRSRLRRLKLAFCVMRKVQKVMLDLGHRGARSDKTPLEMMSASLRGGLAREGKYLGMMTRSANHVFYVIPPPNPILCRSTPAGGTRRKLSGEKLPVLLRELRSFLDEVPDHLEGIHEARQRVETASRLLEDEVDGEGSNSVQVAEEFGDWLVGYFQSVFLFFFQSRFFPLRREADTQCPQGTYRQFGGPSSMGDLAYGINPISFRGKSPCPLLSLSPSPYLCPLVTRPQMLNPAPRATIVSALLQPHTFLPPTQGDSTMAQRVPIWKLPDASILFRRYLEAGRMINVYDWYESFSQVIESQRSHLAPATDGGEDGATKGDEEEEWKMHVQARFVRALHTLDFVGLVKHTGRKAEHVMRTVYDVPE